MKSEIMKVKIKLGSVEVEMTLEEVKDLQRVLNEAFPLPTINYYPTYPWYVPHWYGSASGTTYTITSASTE
jgi:hypothetical protein